jgi:hypothetical protein
MNIRYIIGTILSVSILFGCQSKEAKDSQLALLKTTNPSPMVVEKKTEENLELVDKIKKDVADFEEIYDVAVIKGNGDVLVVYKVKHLKRFHMKKIEKKMTKLLEKNYPDEEFTVSSDYKIFMEAVELNEKMQDPKYSEEKAKKKFNQILELEREMT